MTFVQKSARKTLVKLTPACLFVLLFSTTSQRTLGSDPWVCHPDPDVIVGVHRPVGRVEVLQGVIDRRRVGVVRFEEKIHFHKKIQIWKKKFQHLYDNPRITHLLGSNICSRLTRNWNNWLHNAKNFHYKFNFLNCFTLENWKWKNPFFIEL